MGIRMALGADRSVIRKLVIWQSMRLTLVGVAMGIAAAFELVRLIASFLFRDQALGSGGFRLSTALPILCGAACHMAACQARLEARSNAGAAHRIAAGKENNLRFAKRRSRHRSRE